MGHATQQMSAHQEVKNISRFLLLFIRQNEKDNSTEYEDLTLVVLSSDFNEP